MGGMDGLAGLVSAGPLARTVADAALLLDALAAPSPWSLTPPTWEGGGYVTGTALNAGVRGEGRFQLGVMTSSPWDSAYDITIAPEAHAALDLAREHLDAIGHGIEELALEPDDTYAPAFRTIWQAGAANVPVEGERNSSCSSRSRAGSSSAGAS